MEELIKAVRKHAIANYEEGGWDIVVECWVDEYIGTLIFGATTPEEAIKLVGDAVGDLDEYRQDIQATAF